MSKGHSEACSGAVVTSTEQCKCQCDGAFHGGPNLARARALVWPEDSTTTRVVYSKRQVNSAKRKVRDALQQNAAGADKICTDLVGYSLIHEVITAGEQEQREAKAFIELLVSPFARSISEAELSPADQTQIKNIVLNEHILCVLCVDVLKVLDRFCAEGESMLDEIPDAVIQPLIDQKFLSADEENEVRVAVWVAVRASAQALLNALNRPLFLNLLRLVGIVTCPSIRSHVDIEHYCIDPLIEHWITPALSQWIQAGFPAGSPVLASRRRHR